jgi:hypothetical protein
LASEAVEPESDRWRLPLSHCLAYLGGFGSLCHCQEGWYLPTWRILSRISSAYGARVQMGTGYSSQQLYWFVRSWRLKLAERVRLRSFDSFPSPTEDA